MINLIKRAVQAARFLSDISIDNAFAPCYNFKDKYSGSPPARLAASGRTFF